MNNKILKIDLIFIIGIIIIASLGALVDFFYWRGVEHGGFPVFSLMSIYVSYGFLIVLLIYSIIKTKRNNNMAIQKPKLVRWYSFLLIPIYQVFYLTIVLILLSILSSLFKL